MNPSNPDAIVNENRINVYHVIDGQEILHQKVHGLVDDVGYEFFESEEDGYIISIHLNSRHAYRPGVYRTIVEWDTGDRDILDATFTKGHLFVESLRINDVLKVKVDDGFYILVK